EKLCCQATRKRASLHHTVLIGPSARRRRRMSLFPSTIRNLFRPVGRNRDQRLTNRPRLEALEDRCLPALTTGTITGMVFVDGNGNGAFDAGETGLPGVAVKLTGTTTQ